MNPKRNVANGSARPGFRAQSESARTDWQFRGYFGWAAQNRRRLCFVERLEASSCSGQKRSCVPQRGWTRYRRLGGRGLGLSRFNRLHPPQADLSNVFEAGGLQRSRDFVEMGGQIPHVRCDRDGTAGLERLEASLQPGYKQLLHPGRVRKGPVRRSWLEQFSNLFCPGLDKVGNALDLLIGQRIDVDSVGELSSSPRFTTTLLSFLANPSASA